MNIDQLKTQRQLFDKRLLLTYNNYTNDKKLQTDYGKSHLLYLYVRACQDMMKISTNKQIMLEALLRTLTGHY